MEDDNQTTQSEQPELDLNQRYKKYFPLTVETCRSFMYERHDDSSKPLYGYKDANNDTAAELTRILKRAKDFKELKTEIEVFIKGRRDCNKAINKNYWELTDRSLFVPTFKPRS